MRESSINQVRGELIKRYGHQYRAANELGLREARLSSILRGRAKPNERERAKLESALGSRLANRFFKEMGESVAA